MQYNEFIQRVQEYASVETSDEAIQLTEAVLATLGEHLYRTGQSDLAAELPRGIKEFLVAKQPHETSKQEVQHFSLEEFYHRVGARVNTRHPHAVRQAKAVMAVLQEAVSPGQIDDIKQELPEEFNELFQRET